MQCQYSYQGAAAAGGASAASGTQVRESLFGCANVRRADTAFSPDRTTHSPNCCLLGRNSVWRRLANRTTRFDSKEPEKAIQGVVRETRSRARAPRATTRVVGGGNGCGAFGG